MARSDYNLIVSVKLVLGTANFGNAYGVSALKNTGAVVDKLMANRILAECVELKIEEIDTAPSYGPAQDWLSAFSGRNNFTINSKIPWLGLQNVEVYKKSLQKTINVFEGLQIRNILWHNWEPSSLEPIKYFELHQLLDPEGFFDFGVTTYGFTNAIESIRIGAFQSTQIEFNILNQNALTAFLATNSLTKPRLYLRSIFLQGSLSEEGSSLIAARPALQIMVSRARFLAKEWQLAIEEMALRAVLNLVSTGSVVVGVDSDLQLHQLYDYLSKGPLPPELFNQVTKLDASSDPEIDPRNWKP
jgi:aryl-alcohol dehydrogenase-like predicted oxidoreductase